MNPKKLGKLDNHHQEPWKAPLPQFIEELYFKHFHKDRPDIVVSIEERARQLTAKKAERREAKRMRIEQMIGIAWYLEEQWNKLREISADADLLEETYVEWLATAESTLTQLVNEGLEVKKVAVDANELEAWCREQSMPINATARSQFAAHLLQKSHMEAQRNDEHTRNH
jgi:hypothetical protein